jgi:hypothetical protein
VNIEERITIRQIQFRASVECETPEEFAQAEADRDTLLAILDYPAGAHSTAPTPQENHFAMTGCDGSGHDEGWCLEDDPNARPTRSGNS